MKIISILRGLSTSGGAKQVDLERKVMWLRDPLAHPDLETMSERELADLPFARGWRPGNGAGSCRT